VFLSEALNGLVSQLLDPVGSTRRGAQTGILRFTIDIFVYKWLPLIIGEIISKNWYFKCLPLFSNSGR